MAWNPARRRKTPAGERRPGAQAGPNSHRRRANRVVGPLLGQNGLRLRPIGPERELHHRRLRGLLGCGGSGGSPPVSLLEFTLDSPEDFYDVSLVDGFNLPVSIVPSGGSGNCSAVICNSNLNLECPEKLQVRG
ncbi:thaumatin-like protein, partial [Phtheirospermum japonicum]